MTDAASSPVAEFSIKLLVMCDGSVSVRVTREAADESFDPRMIDEALGPAMETLGDKLAQDIAALKCEYETRALLKR